jgi:hypothetical protein
MVFQDIPGEESMSETRYDWYCLMSLRGENRLVGTCNEEMYSLSLDSSGDIVYIFD